MSNRKPIVLGDDAGLQQLQSQDELDIPLEDRFQALSSKFAALVYMLAEYGFNDIGEKFSDDIVKADSERV